MGSVDEFLQQALERKVEDERVSALIEVNDPAWEPPSELGAEIQALAADPLVRRIEGSFDVPRGRVPEEGAAEA